MGASVFEEIGVARVRSGTGSNSLFSIDGASGIKSFGILQGIEISERVSLQTRRTLRNEPILFPAGDELAEINVSFMTPLIVLCGDSVATWSDAADLYAKKRAKPGGKLEAVSIQASGQGYTGFIVGLHLSGSVVNGLPVVTVSLRMVGSSAKVRG